MSTIETIPPSDPRWKSAWDALKDALAKLPPEHEMFGETSCDPFMLMYAQNGLLAFKHIVTRRYLFVDSPDEGRAAA